MKMKSKFWKELIRFFLKRKRSGLKFNKFNSL